MIAVADELTEITMRRTRLALDQIAVLETGTPTPARISMRDERIRQLAEHEPLLVAYAKRIRGDIADMQKLQPGHPDAHRVLEELPELRDRLRLLDSLLADIGTHTPEPTGAGEATTKESS